MLSRIQQLNIACACCANAVIDVASNWQCDNFITSAFEALSQYAMCCCEMSINCKYTIYAKFHVIEHVDLHVKNESIFARIMTYISKFFFSFNVFSLISLFVPFLFNSIISIESQHPYTTYAFYIFTAVV